MGIFGTSKDDEEALRKVAQQTESNQSDGYSMTGSSAYETADENDDDGHDDVASNAIPEPQLKDTPYNSGSSNEHDDQNTFHKNGTSSVLSKSDDEPEAIEDFTGAAAEKDIQNEKVSEEDQGIPLKQLDWDGPDDKGNPLNWPKWKRWYITITTALICMCVSLGSSLYISGVFELMNTTGASRELCISGLSLYLVGLAWGPALAAPLSETFGRKIVYLASFPTSMLFTMGIGLSNKIYQILILRFFCGLIASPALAVAGGTINDIWGPEDAGFAMALFCLAPFLGPVLGPIVGGFAAEHKGWKWTMWVSLMFSGSVLPFVLFLPETYKPQILQTRAKKRGIKLIKPPTLQLIKVTLSITMLRPLQMLVIEPIVLVWSFYIAFVFAVLFGFFEAFPIIFQKVYLMDMGVSGLTFIGVGTGLMLGVLVFIIIDKLVFFKKNPDGTKGARDENGNLVALKPESILFVGKIGAVCLPVALFWLAWTGRKSIHWICPVLSGVPFGFGLILIFFANMLYFSFSFPPACVASALGANNLLRYLLASAFPLFTTQMYEKLHVDWATSIFAFIAVALLPIPWIFEKIGPRLRQRSKFGYAAIANQATQAKPAKEKDLEEEIGNETASLIV